VRERKRRLLRGLLSLDVTVEGRDEPFLGVLLLSERKGGKQTTRNDEKKNVEREKRTKKRITNLGDQVLNTNARSATFTTVDSETRTAQDNEEVHTINTDSGVVLETQVNVFLNTETEVTGLREVTILEFHFVDLETLLQDFEGFLTTDSDVSRDLFVTTNTECTDGKTSWRKRTGGTKGTKREEIKIERTRGGEALERKETPEKESRKRESKQRRGYIPRP
jgi:hypothetical protein